MGGPDQKKRAVAIPRPVQRAHAEAHAPARPSVPIDDDEPTSIDQPHPNVPSMPTEVNAPIGLSYDSGPLAPPIPSAPSLAPLPSSPSLFPAPSGPDLVPTPSSPTSPGGPPPGMGAQPSFPVPIVLSKSMDEEATRLAGKKAKPKTGAGQPVPRRPVARRAVAAIRAFTGEVSVVSGRVKVRYKQASPAKKRVSILVLLVIGLVSFLGMAQLVRAFTSSNDEPLRLLPGQKAKPPPGLFERFFQW